MSWAQCHDGTVSLAIRLTGRTAAESRHVFWLWVDAAHPDCRASGRIPLLRSQARRLEVVAQVTNQLPTLMTWKPSSARQDESTNLTFVDACCRRRIVAIVAPGRMG